MRIGIITPAPPRSRYGNRVTALRWARILKNLGHRVTVAQTYEGGKYDLLVALHARRSYFSISRFHSEHAKTPIIVALTGTDLYRDLQNSRLAQQSLEIATRIVVLHPNGIDELPPHLRFKARVIYQSVAVRHEAANYHRKLKSDKAALISDVSRFLRTFDVCVVGHLRPVKDPFRTALAARLLPLSSRIRVLHVGGAMSDEMAARARAEMEVNPRYLWLDEQSRWRTRRILTQSQLCVLSSLLEGGANVLSEAIVASVPIVASRIPGTVGIMGADYPGYITVGNTRELMRLLIRAEADPDFLGLLKSHSERLIRLFDPAREQRAWANLLGEIAGQA
ncbi:MAG: TIGR04348 family glycosyltransferase [Acidobacteria bacterium]|nr:TIGR04348 family glycosyltransferase [Acidobacteriota bacterium]